jgi:hypothetical protein
MKVIYEGYSIIPKYEIRADAIPVQSIYTTYEAARDGLRYFLKDGVVKKATVIVEDAEDLSGKTEV